MFRFSLRCTLLIGAASMVPVHAVQANEDADREYLPTEILVIGDAGEYISSDGSTGTKTPTPLINVPQTVAVVTEDQLDDQSIRQLGDALRYVPGISIETGEGHRDEVFIRGQETTADFYLDGLRDDAQYYRPLYNVSRVEVLKGANALIFGRGGGGGVVNRVSKTADLSGDSVELDGSVNSFGAFALSGDVNAALNETIAIRINSTFEQFDNNRNFYSGNFFGFSPTLTAKLSDATQLTVHYTFDNDERVVDRGNPAFNDGDPATVNLPLMGFDDTFFGDADFNQSSSVVHIARTRLDHNFSDALSINASLQYAYYDKAYANILPLRTDGTSVEFSGYRDTQDRENLIGQVNLIWNVDTGAVGHTILAGFEASRQDTQNGRQDARFANGTGGVTSRLTLPLSDIFTFPAISLTAPVRDRDSNLTVYSGYIQNQISIGDYVELIGGIRWDRFDLETKDLLSGIDGDRVDEEFSPRFGVVIKPSATVSFYGSYAESFLPQAGDQFLILSPGDSAFAPEKFTNYEIGAKWLVNSGLFFTASLFKLERSNTLAADPNNTGLLVLTGTSETEGIELSLVGEILPGWEANIGYTYLDGEITGASSFGAQGQRLQQLPRHQISAWNHVDISDRFSLGLGVIYQDEQFASFSNNVLLPDYVRVDAAAYYQVNERVTFQLNIENALDENYYPSAHGDNNIQPGVPFNARLGLRVTL